MEVQKKSSKKTQMQVYCRIRPNYNNQRAISYKIDQKNKVLDIAASKNKSYKDNLEFKYSEIFDQSATQEDIFEKMAVPVVQNCLEGYNGTIFAYGQTGSGKTYTMSGAESWQLRGIIPRVIQIIFDETDKIEDMEYTLYVSFMEIYNENAYDLLERKHLESPIESWNKINMFEDDYGNIHLKNISVHLCQSEQEGIDWLMMGNFIRQVSATPVNHVSSRSHCVFTITIEGKNTQTSQVFASKLHLVDLAGSERVGRNQAEGQLLNEAKYINLSLTYLEQVILALNEKRKTGRAHIPYRNSLLTTILKDSLGGNCKTVMIATISPEIENYEESISTLRFSQRVAALENEISKKEKVDLQLMVNKLEQEKLILVRELENYQNVIKQMQGGDDFLQIYQNQLQQGLIQPPDRKQFSQQEQLNVEMSEEQMKNIDEDTLFKVDQFLNEKEDKLHVQNVQQSYTYFYAMKYLYNTRMKEYVTELTYISEKLQKYDELLSKRKQAKEQQQQSNQQLNQEKQITNQGQQIQTQQVQKIQDKYTQPQQLISQQNQSQTYQTNKSNLIPQFNTNIQKQHNQQQISQHQQNNINKINSPIQIQMQQQQINSNLLNQQFKNLGIQQNQQYQQQNKVLNQQQYFYQK